MGFFATKARAASRGSSSSVRLLSDDVRRGLPTGFEAVAEALTAGSGSAEACDVAGRNLAQDGASLDEVLEGLRFTSLAVIDREPTFAEVQALSVAWSEATLAYLHQLSCEDPLTGLASLAHVRACLSELYRGQLREGAGLDETHALVVVDLPNDRPGLASREGDSFSQAMRLVRLGEAARTVFAGGETVGRLGPSRVVIVVGRDAQLGRRVAVLRKLLSMADYPTRVWIEGLPSGDSGAALLLDELARP